jgi:hypothetical protein
MKHARSDYNRIQDPENLIPDDEPVFLIRGKDKVAPSTVEAWAALAEQAGASAEIVYAARQQAARMKLWQDSKGCQIPDAPLDTITPLCSRFNTVPRNCPETASPA